MENYKNELMDLCVRFLKQKSNQEKVDYFLGDDFRIYCNDCKRVLIIEYKGIEAVKLLYTKLRGRRVLGDQNGVGNTYFKIECNSKAVEDMCKIISNSNLIEY